MSSTQYDSDSLDGLSLDDLHCEKLKRELRAAATRKGDWFKVLQPYTVILVTAIISGYLVPSFTRRWQDHQEQIELKTNLATEISESVSRFATAIQFYERKQEASIPGGYNEAYYEWEIRSAQIDSKIGSYSVIRN